MRETATTEAMTDAQLLEGVRVAMAAKNFAVAEAILAEQASRAKAAAAARRKDWETIQRAKNAK